MIEELSFMHYLKTQGGYVDPKPLDDGRYAALFQFMFTWAIVTGRIGDRNCYEDRWCYHDEDVARVALDAWDGTGEPEGWHRHPMTGRRRESGKQEEIHW